MELFYLLMLGISGACILLESSYSLLAKKRLYRLSDSATNFTLYAVFFAVNAVWAHTVFALYTWVGSHCVVNLTSGVWHIGNNGLWWEWLLLFVLEDLCFYCFHRANHRVSMFWASHVTHHSSRFFNLSVAFRQTPIPFFGVLFWLPLPLLGFDPLMILTVQVVSLFYQDLMHTQVVPTLGPLEWILNTPSHHAIHHASNPSYVDKNYGGILIIWDRLFGSFALKSEPLRFGLTHNISSNGPVHAAFHGWARMFKEIWQQRSLRVALRPPS